MSEGEVVARIGPPDLTTGKGRRLARWTWMPVPGDPDTITVVLFDVVRRMKQCAANPKDDANFWKPAPLLARLAAEGGTFNGEAA